MSAVDPNELRRLAARIAIAHAQTSGLPASDLPVVIRLAFDALYQTQVPKPAPVLPVKRPRGRPRKYPT